jgi:CDP-paratose 2-epimerase
MAGADVIVPVNLLGAFHCFEAARAHGAQVVFLSTSRVYPVARIEALEYRETESRYELVGLEGIDEQFPLAGARTMYGASKLAAELLLMEYDLDWVVNRCGVIAGPWQMGKVDQGVFTHWMAAHVIGRPLTYIGYGGTGKQVRDLLHVDDIVDLVELQLTDAAAWRGLTFNVGGGRAGSLSLRETTELCREIAGREVPIGAETQTRPGDVRCYLSDCRALFGHTAWRPARTPHDVLEDLFRWLSENRNLLLNVFR